MAPLRLFAVVFLVNVVLLTQTLADNTAMELRAPAFPEGVGKESYMCMTKNLPDRPMRLVEVHALAKREIVHHILLYACSKPAKVPVGEEIVSWECLGHATCEGGFEEIIYGWGKDAPPLVYPPDIGLAVGPGSAIKYIVVQVHYLKGQPPNDDSGVRMVLSPEPRPFGAGLLAYASWFTIPPRTPSYLVNTTCCYRGIEPLTTFAMRVHTHDLGKRVWLERLNGTSSSELLAENNPQLPQFFYNVTRHTLRTGQHLRAICDFDSSDRSEPVSVGATHEFEMCNLYMMVFSRIPFTTMCTGNLNGGLGFPGALDIGFSLVEDPSGFDAPVPKDSGDWGDAAGDATSVASSPDGSVWVLHRGSHHWQADTFDDQFVVKTKDTITQKVVMKLDADTGDVSTVFGAGVLNMPHMITVDEHGDVWVTDTGKHQVFKFSPDGKQLLAVGTEYQPGKDESHFCQPSAVAVLLDGSFIVADGYCNNRLVKFDAAGKFVAADDLPASNVGPAVVHSLLVDECRGVVLVAQREAGLLLMLDLVTLKPKGTYDLTKYGKVWAVKMGPYGSPIVMTWKDGQPIKFLQLNANEQTAPGGAVVPELELSMPNTAGAVPNDFAIGAASTSVTGAGSRLLAFYVARICADCGPVTKWIAVPKDFPAYASNHTARETKSADDTLSPLEEELLEEEEAEEEAEEAAIEEEAEAAEEEEALNEQASANSTTTTNSTTITNSTTTTNSSSSGKQGGVEVALKPAPAEPATPMQKAADAVLSKLDKVPNAGALPTGSSGSAALTESKDGKAGVGGNLTDVPAGKPDATPSTPKTTSTPSTPSTTSTPSTPSSTVQKETDPQLAAGGEYGDDYDDGLYYEEVLKFKEAMEKKASTTPVAAVVMTSHTPHPAEVEDVDSEVMVVTKYTTRRGSAMQVVLVACVIAVFLAVFAINTLGGMKAKVYHPLASLDDSLPVVNTSSSPFMMDTKPVARRRVG